MGTIKILILKSLLMHLKKSEGILRHPVIVPQCIA